MDEKKTYIINIDGMRADYFRAIGHQGILTPTLISLAFQGSRYTNCIDIMPANTGTNHTAIITSAHAGSHGILGAVGYYAGLNYQSFRLSKNFGTPIGKSYGHHHLQVPTFFNIIKQNNPDLVTAFIPSKTWMGNILADQDCDITIFPGNTPDNCDEHQPNPDYITPCEGYVLGGLAHPEDNEMLPRFYIPKKDEQFNAPPATVSFPHDEIHADAGPSDAWIIDQAISCIEHDNPDFMYIILMNMDAAGHFHGTFSTESASNTTTLSNLSTLRNPEATKDQLYLTDNELSRFIRFLKKKDLFQNSRIVITSDHAMSTMKSLYSGVSRKNMLYWLLEKARLIRRDTSNGFFQFGKMIETLDVDIRKILRDNGISMKASQGRWLHRYNSRGFYDWCYSDGATVGYIYNVKPEIQKRIRAILKNFIIMENGIEVHPVWMVLTEEDMGSAINDHTGESFGLNPGDFDQSYDHVWPSVIIFLKPHFMIPLYNDQLKYGFTPMNFAVTLPYFIDIRTVPGSHGSYLEQHVPLILVSPSESSIPQDKLHYSQVSVLDIIPTINALNGWPKQTTFEGSPLIKTKKKKK